MIYKEKIDEIHQFWFGELQGGLASDDVKRRWYQSTKGDDEYIAQHFGEIHKLASKGKLVEWASSAQGRLALIIILDQFSRHLYRGTADAFRFDSQALELCLAGIERGHDKQLSLAERLFFYHPLEHAEDIQHQHTCVALTQEFAESLSGQARQEVDNALKYMHEHRDIVEAFGRFPHRNNVLGRESTQDELAYLNENGKTFGQ